MAACARDELSNSHPHHHTSPPRHAIFARPHVTEFLDWAFDAFSAVALWTRAGRDWADAALSIKQVTGEKNRGFRSIFYGGSSFSSAI